MARLDHLAMPVSDRRRSRDGYVETLGLTVEFELPEQETVALQDENDFTSLWLRVSFRFGCGLPDPDGYLIRLRDE